jgi:hypothetical protein
MNAAEPPCKNFGVSRFAAAAEGQKSRRAAADLNIFGFGLCTYSLWKKTRSIFFCHVHGIEKDRVKIVKRSGCQNG